MHSTTNFSIPDKNLPYLKRFGAFLLDHHLQEAAEANIVLARQMDLPILKSFAHLSEQDFLALVKESLKTFLHQLEKQTVLEDAKDGLRKWRKDTLPIIPRSGVAAADLVLVYHVRKQLLLSFLHRFTTDVTEASAIAKELDHLYAQVEQFAFSLYIDLKEEEHGAILEELQEKNNELATALEELQAAEEQLVEVNNELEERVKTRTQALAASEQQLRTITDALPGMVTYIDREERFRFINKTYEAWFGVSRNLVMGKKLEEVLGHQTGERMETNPYNQIKQYVKRALKGEQLHYETTLMTKGKKPKHVLVNYVPHIEEGHVLGYYALFTDIHERVEAEQALKQSEARFSNIFNQSSVGMAEVDLTGKFVLVNDRYCELVGRSREELYQIRMQDISHEGDVSQNMSLFQKAVEGGTPFTIEKRYTRTDGSQVWVRNNVSVVKDHHNQPSSVVAVCLDITKKKEAQQALQESKDLFHSFADNIQSLAWMADSTGKVIWYNQRWFDYTGTNLEDMQQQGWVPVLHPDHINRVIEHAKKARQRGENWELTMPLRRADGEWGWFLARTHAIKDVEGNVIRWIGTSTEITEQVKTQQQLQEANKEIADLLEREKFALAEANTQRSTLYNTFMQAPSLLCITRGYELVYELANPYYLEVFELKKSIEGKRLDEVFPNPDPSIISIHHQVLDTGIAYVGEELPVLSDWKQNGNPYTRYFNVRYAPLYEGGSIRGIITFGYEVTEHVSARQELEQNAALMGEMNQELNQKNIELSRINNDLDNFIYTASHDLRSPLLNLEGLLLALNKRLTGSITPQAVNLLELASVSIEKLKRTIKDLTDITKAQKGIDDVQEIVLFNDILDDIEADLPENINNLENFIKKDFQITSIEYSKAGLRTIFYNLLSNAIKYKSADRPLEIRISTQKDNKYIILTIEDNGLGIPEQKLPKLFTMFTRFHTHVEGTGIGLYTIKRVIENNGGRIEVSSQLNKGTTFKVYLLQHS
ncbi:PAS domain-containing protein [Flammeovirgaceae bacterium 311]|nr:PAS domain-containing protein [Flammeovirgaceae bacterium 311]